MKRELVFLVICILYSSLSFADSYEGGVSAYKAGNFAEAVKHFRQAADRANINAQISLAVMYDNSLGVNQDYAEAVKWYRKAADHGNAEGQTSLGFMYEIGRGVDQSYAEAVKWYQKAANQGNGRAQSNLGLLYSSGHGVNQDYSEVVKWFRKAADQEFVQAQTNLGIHYVQGLGVNRDYVQAYMWFQIAGDSGFADAIKYRNSIANKMTLDEINEADWLVAAWKPKQARDGDMQQAERIMQNMMNLKVETLGRPKFLYTPPEIHSIDESILLAFGGKPGQAWSFQIVSDLTQAISHSKTKQIIQRNCLRTVLNVTNTIDQIKINGNIISKEKVENQTVEEGSCPLQTNNGRNLQPDSSLKIWQDSVLYREVTPAGVLVDIWAESENVEAKQMAERGFGSTLGNAGMVVSFPSEPIVKSHRWKGKPEAYGELETRFMPHYMLCDILEIDSIRYALIGISEKFIDSNPMEIKDEKGVLTQQVTEAEASGFMLFDLKHSRVSNLHLDYKYEGEMSATDGFSASQTVYHNKRLDHMGVKVLHSLLDKISSCEVATKYR